EASKAQLTARLPERQFRLTGSAVRGNPIQPFAEHNQGPQRPRMVGLAPTMLGKQIQNCLPPEAKASKAFRRKPSLCPIMQWTPQPTADGNGKSAFSAIDDMPGKIAERVTLEKVFRGKPANALRWWKLGSEFHDIQIEEWRPQFERP